ncbi:hexokinase [Gregarina niphandrodes]|uniref:Hexokinase n=1 Tax=Gregarina niphandrodes TaxID=110365 RepID=A0A023AY87_GRENI|nr:hexokinase [Gregarina niphandrodes]EZG43619.1 hexokinase [Gregarina niphandrodes]|eukprot:XP_011133147.1 hexokinase [Gregarina niphandrodes]
MENTLLELFTLDDNVCYELKDNYHKSFINSLSNHQAGNSGTWTVENGGVKAIDTFLRSPSSLPPSSKGLGFVINEASLQLCLVDRAPKNAITILDRQECELEPYDDLDTVCKCCVKMIQNLPIPLPERTPLVICAVASIVYQQGLRQAYLLDGQFASDANLCSVMEKTFRNKKLGEQVFVAAHVCEMAASYLSMVLDYPPSVPRVHCVVDRGVGIACGVRHKNFDGNVILAECQNFAKGIPLTFIDRQLAALEPDSALHTLERLVSIDCMAELVRLSVLYLLSLDQEETAGKLLWTRNTLSAEDVLAIVNSSDSPSAVLRILGAKWDWQLQSSNEKEYLNRLNVARITKLIAQALVRRAGRIMGCILQCIIRYQKESEGTSCSVTLGGRVCTLACFRHELMNQLRTRHEPMLTLGHINSTMALEKVELIRGGSDIPSMAAISASLIT